MTKKDVKNLNLVLEKLEEKETLNLQEIAEWIKLESSLLEKKLIPILINRKCIKKILIGKEYRYVLEFIGQEYLHEKKFNKEYNKKIKRNIGYYLHWCLTAVALGMSAYSIFIN